MNTYNATYNATYNDNSNDYHYKNLIMVFIFNILCQNYRSMKYLK